MLKAQSISTGFVWTFFDVLVNRGGFFFASIFLARIIGPEKFAVFAILALIGSLANAFIDSGLSTSLVRSKSINNDDLNTMFFATQLLSLIVFLFFFITSPLISQYYNLDISLLIKIFCISFFFIGMRSIHVILLVREMNFKKIALLNLPGNIISFVISFILASNGYQVWSLVSLFLTNQVITTFLYWLFIPWKPDFFFSKSVFIKHFSFGYKLLISTQINILFDNIYSILIGRLFPPRILSCFERAYAFNAYPASVLSAVMQKVTLPAFMKVSEDRIKLDLLYKKISTSVFFISVICFGIGFLIIEPLVKLALGTEWLPVAPIFRILVIGYSLYPLHALNINILNVNGRSDLFLKLEILKKIILALIIIISISFGLKAMIWANVLFSFISFFINAHYSSKFINYSILTQIKDVVQMLFIGILIFTPTYYLSNYWQNSSSLFQIIYPIGLSILFIILLCETIKYLPYLLLKRMLIKVINYD